MSVADAGEAAASHEFLSEWAERHRLDNAELRAETENLEASTARSGAMTVWSSSE